MVQCGMASFLADDIFNAVLAKDRHEQWRLIQIAKVCIEKQLFDDSFKQVSRYDKFLIEILLHEFGEDDYLREFKSMMHVMEHPEPVGRVG